MFNINNLNKYIKEWDGNRSTIMGLMENDIIKFCKNPKSGFHENEHYMLYEFCLFDDDYFRIKKDMLENDINLDVIDIGCQCGFQSEIFNDREYIGIECSGNFFFNQDKENVNYIIGTFPIKGLNLNIENKIVISNMSLGFFNMFLGEKSNRIKEYTLTDIDKMLIEELSKSKILYCNSRHEFVEELKSKFKYNKFLGRPFKSNVSTGVYKFWN